MRRLFWTRSVYRVRKSYQGVTGQLTTSSRQETANQTTTSTIFNLYAEPVMVESKTGYCSESHGATPGTTKGVGYSKGWGRRLVLVFNDLLPQSIRPSKGRRRRGPVRYRWGAELYYWRRRWHGGGKYRVRSAVNKLQFWKKR